MGKRDQYFNNTFIKLLWQSGNGLPNQEDKTQFPRSTLGHGSYPVT